MIIVIAASTLGHSQPPCSSARFSATGRSVCATSLRRHSSAREKLNRSLFCLLDLIEHFKFLSDMLIQFGLAPTSRNHRAALHRVWQTRGSCHRIPSDQGYKLVLWGTRTLP